MRVYCIVCRTCFEDKKAKNYYTSHPECGDAFDDAVDVEAKKRGYTGHHEWYHSDSLSEWHWMQEWITNWKRK